MKCNYKKHLPIKEKIFTFEDKSHFTPFGSCFMLGDTYSDFIGHPDGVTLHLDMCNLMLIYTLNHPTKEEISNFQQGELKFALAEDNNILFLLNKFGSIPWGSSNQNYSLNTSVYQLDDNANIMSLLLFDSSNGKLVAMRNIGLHWHFVKALNDGIRKQLSTPYSIEEFSRLVKSTYRKYPTDLDLLKDAYYFYDFHDKETNEMLDRKLKR